MRICRFDDNRLGVVTAGEVHDVTEALEQLPKWTSFSRAPSAKKDRSSVHSISISAIAWTAPRGSSNNRTRTRNYSISVQRRKSGAALLTGTKARIETRGSIPTIH